MARIPDEVVERLKAELDLAELVTRSGVVLEAKGRDLVGRCPFHDDDTPSLVVTPSKGLWHCLGACQVGGSAIDWVMKAQGVSFRHAVEVLRCDVDPVIVAGRRGSAVAKTSRARRLPSPLDVTAEDRSVLADVVDYYHRTLLDSPEALAYLTRRQIDDQEVTSRFRLGFANRTLGYRLPAKRTKDGDRVRGRLQELGVLRASGHEHFTGSLVVPVTDPGGTVTELYGRKITSSLRTGTPDHLYLPGPHRGVWNEDGLTGGSVILCESLIDALTFFCFGFQNVTAAYGTSGFTADHTNAFERQRVRRVLIAYDHDAAGDVAAAKVARELMASGIECFRVVFPYGQDANHVATGADQPERALGALVREAQWMGAGTAAGNQSAPVADADVHESLTDVAGTEGTQTADASGEPVPSSAAVSSAAPPVPAQATNHDELVIVAGPRRWRVRHIPKAPSPGSLRVNVMVGSGERFHVDTVDLYSARQRTSYVEAGATELRCDPAEIRSEMARVLLAVEDAQSAAIAPQADTAPPTMTTAQRESALSLLGSPDLMDRVAEAFITLGVVGEQTSALTTWLTLTSRLSDRPLGAVIQSSSSAGKSTLADAALALMPTEATVAYSAMTGQALYYLGEHDLAHKVLAVAEEEGAARASYALKLLVSEGRLSIAAAGKDPVSGRLVTHTYEVTGPVALLLTTTSPELDEELANRLLVLAVDEGRHQTRAVQVAQRYGETVEGLVARSRRTDVIALHVNAQRLLSPIAVVNPHAPSLGFSDRTTRNRRDNAKYLGLIRAVTLAHQFQREPKQVTVGGKAVTYIEATEVDVALAEQLCASVLATTTDELSPATRRLLGAIVEFSAANEGRFTRRALRDSTGLGDSQLKVHLGRLVDLEYVTCERAGPLTSYELSTPYDRDRPGPDPNRPGPDPNRPGIGRFSRRSDTRPSSQVNGAEPPIENGSAGIGRVTPDAEKPPATSEDGPSRPDRPGLRAIRGTGTDSDKRVVVAR